MGIIFSDSMIEDFMDQIQKPSKNEDGVTENVISALTLISEHINLAACKATLAQPNVSMKIDDLSSERCLYESGMEHGDDYVEEAFTTGDNGIATLSFYVRKDCEWSRDDIKVIKFLAKQMFMVFSNVRMATILKHAMITDAMCEIPNLSGYFEYGNKLIHQGKISRYIAGYLNVKNFKYVNKVVSYDEGNEVIKQYAQNVNGILEEDEIICRLGGDNFVVLVKNENIHKFIDYINDVHISLISGGDVKNFVFGASVGLYDIKEEDVLPEMGAIMMPISIAQQVAKQRGDGSTVYYSFDLFKRVMKDKEIGMKFDKALEKREFVVYYQPKINVTTKEICGAEALSRWMADGKVVPPIEFIPTLERDSNICKLDFYVLDVVCHQIRRWIDEDKPITKISVNFSKCHLENPNLAKDISNVLKKYGINPDYIEIELTESANFEDYRLLSELVKDLKECGITTSIDDFGTGYSSLNMLKNIDANIIKIDKSFLNLEIDSTYDMKDKIMIKNIVRIANDFKMESIAEGVETNSQFMFLKSVDCDMVQGYLFDRPLTVDDFESRMKIGRY